MNDIQNKIDLVKDQMDQLRYQIKEKHQIDLMQETIYVQMCKSVIELQHLIMQKNYLNDTLMTMENTFTLEDINLNTAQKQQKSLQKQNFQTQDNLSSSFVNANIQQIKKQSISKVLEKLDNNFVINNSTKKVLNKDSQNFQKQLNNDLSQMKIKLHSHSLNNPVHINKENVDVKNKSQSILRNSNYQKQKKQLSQTQRASSTQKIRINEQNPVIQLGQQIQDINEQIKSVIKKNYFSKK